MTIHVFGLFSIRALKTLHNCNICTHLQCTVSIVRLLKHCSAFSPRWWEEIESRTTLYRFEFIRTRSLRAFRSIHPYGNPEVLSLAVDDGSLAYMKWMDEAIPDDWYFVKAKANLSEDCRQTRKLSHVCLLILTFFFQDLESFKRSGSAL